MFVNVLNADDLKAYVKAVAYGNGDEIVLTADNLKDLDFITENRDMIIRAMVAQFIKKRLEEHLKKSENVSFLTSVTEGDTLPNWAQNTLARGETLYRFNSKNIPRDLTEQIGGVRDYLYSVAMEDVDNKIRAGKKKTSAEEKPYIYLDALKRRYPTWEEAIKESDNWHQELAERLKAEADLKESLEGAEFVMDLPGGLKAYRLLTPKALDYESDHMGHCVGAGGYDEKVKNGTIEIYSIRDAKGEPHATFEIGVDVDEDSKWIKQCKGKENKPPVKKYWPAIQTFVEAKKFDFGNNPDMQSMGFLGRGGKMYNVYDLPEGSVIYGELTLDKFPILKMGYPDLSGVTIEGGFMAPKGFNDITKFPKYVTGGHNLTRQYGIFYQDGKMYNIYDLPKDLVIKWLDLDCLPILEMGYPDLSGVTVKHFKAPADFMNYPNKFPKYATGEQTRLYGIFYQDGKMYNVYDLAKDFPDGFTIKGDLNLWDLNVSKNGLPDLSKVTIEGDFYAPVGFDDPTKFPKYVTGGYNLTRQYGIFYQDGKMYNVYDLPKNFVIKGDLDLSELDVSKKGYPDLSNVEIMGTLSVPENATTLEGWFPKSVKNLSCHNCKSLKSIVIPEGVTEIGGGAFAYCSALKSIVIPDSVTKIGESAFEGCQSLSSIVIPDGVTEIEPRAFKDCSSLQSIVIPSGVTEIKSHAFEGCTSLTTLHIPDGVTEIGWGAFKGCQHLQSINIPDGVTEIGYGAFEDCLYLEKITIPKGVTEIRQGTFRNCRHLKSIVLPKGIKEIELEAFNWCTDLTSILLPEGITEINESVFWSCSSLKEIMIPKSVTTIGKWAFDECKSLTSLIIPDSVRKIKEDAFDNCPNLTICCANQEQADMIKRSGFWGSIHIAPVALTQQANLATVQAKEIPKKTPTV